MNEGKKRIALVGFDVAQITAVALNRALVDYSRKNNWEIAATTIETPSIFSVLPEIGCDGAIVRLTSDVMRKAALAAPFPTVNFSAWLEDPGVPTVRRDDRAMGKLAAEHLLDKKFRRFAILPTRLGWFIKSRREGITEVLDQAGAAWSILQALPEYPVEADVARLAEELKKLPVPVGVIITESRSAECFYAAVELAGLKIPLDLAVIGINPPPTYIAPLVPSLSIIDPDEANCGVYAAELLDRLMDGQPAPQQMKYIPPRGLIARDSSDVTCYEDRIVARAVDMIRKQAHLSINATEIAASLDVSSDTLNRHCRKHLGMGPYQYLCTVRVNRVCRLLKSHPEMSLDDVAHTVGIAGRNRLNKVFRRLKNISPADYRKAHMKH